MSKQINKTTIKMVDDSKNKLNIDDLPTVICYDVEYKFVKDLLDTGIYKCSGCKNSIDFIRKYGVEEFDYLYARCYRANEWVYPEKLSTKIDKLVIGVEWIVDNVPEYSTTAKYKYNYMPNILELSEAEQFKDNKGKAVKVEIRGTRHCKCCYFRARDIEIIFGLTSISANILDKKSGHTIHVDYEYFIRTPIRSSCSLPNKKEPNIPVLFLTYEGLTKLIINSKNKRTAPYIDWINQTLFTVQFGTTIAKKKLSAKMHGISYDVLHKLLSGGTCAAPISCVYCVIVGPVGGNLRKEMNIPAKYADTMVVIKCGRTKDFNQRMHGHQQMFKKVPSAKLELAHFSLIDADRVVDAEHELIEKMADFKYEWNNTNEILIIKKTDMKYIREVYANLCAKYCVTSKEVNNCIDLLKQQIVVMQNDNKMKDIELAFNQKEFAATRRATSLANEERERERATNERERSAQKEAIERERAATERERAATERELTSKNKELKMVDALHEAQMQAMCAKYEAQIKNMEIAAFKAKRTNNRT